MGRLKPGPGRPAEEVADHQQGRIRASLLEIVAERGYPAITVRGVAARAGVSTRSFYQHYPNKDACFLSVHQLVVRDVLRAIEEAEPDARDDDACLRTVVGAIVRAWASDPNAAHLMLIDAYAAGLPALKQARLAGRSIEARVGECLDCASDDASLAPLAAEGIVAGITAAARSCLLTGDGDLVGLCNPLAHWADAYHKLPAWQLEEMRLPRHVSASNDATPSSDGEEEEAATAPTGERGLLLAATTKLVTLRGHADFGLEDIVSTAGVSRRVFEAEFADLEACFAAAHQLHADRAIESVVRAGDGLAAAADAPLSLLGAQLATDPVLAVLCFSDVAISGPRLLDSHQRFLGRIASLAAGATEPVGPAVEASAGALWGLLRQRVLMGRAPQALEIAPALASLALLPLRGEPSRLSAS